MNSGMNAVAFFYTLLFSVTIFQVFAVNTDTSYGDEASARRLPDWPGSAAPPVPSSPAVAITTPQPMTTTKVLQPPVLEKEVCPLPVPPGAFPPTITYKYLKAPGPLVNTEVKDTMGGQILMVKHADWPIDSSMFNFVKADNEWKARVKNPQANILTLELARGTGAPNDVTSLCLLQDITLVRTQGQLTMRLDYGYCPIPGGRTEQAFIMVGLQVVPASFQEKTPGIKDFFEGVTFQNKNASLELKKAQAYHDQVKGYSSDHCFVGSADVLHMTSAAVQPCFTEAYAYTWLTEDDEFGVLPITENDYAWLEHQLPFKPPNATEVPMKSYGQVTVDRACVYFHGITTAGGAPCNNACGKWCKSTEESAAA